MLQTFDFLNNLIVRRFTKYIICFILGGIIISSLPPIYFLVSAPLAIIVLSLIFLNNQSLKESLLTGFFAGIGFGCISFYWFFYPIVFATNSNLLGSLAVITAGLIISIFFIGISFVSYFVPKNNTWAIVIYNTAIWSAFEILRGEFLFGGIPWNIIATFWDFNIYMLQTASFIGAYGLGFVTYFLCSCFLLLLSNKAKIFNKAICCLVMAIILVGLHWMGNYRVQLYKKIPLTETRVAVVQPNIKQNDKIEGNNELFIFNNLINTTKALTNNKGSMLVVWPETVISNRLTVNTDLFLVNLERALNNNSTLVAGLFRYDSNGDIFNSAIIFNPTINFLDYYDKIHLVPFGEYIPGTRWLSVNNTFVSDFSFAAGTRNIIFHIDSLPLFKVLICFEAIFSDKTLNNKNVKLAVNISNDGWYGNSVQPYQHLALVKFRAIEGGIPVVRSCNSGVSVLIDSVGNIKQYLPMFTGGYFIAKIPNVYPSYNIFAFIGNNLLYLINTVILLVLFFNSLRKCVVNKKQAG